MGSPASASVGWPNSANSTVGLPASAGSSARAVSAASAVQASSVISVSAASGEMTTSSAGAKDGGSIQGVESLMNPAVTPIARGLASRGVRENGPA